MQPQDRADHAEAASEDHRRGGDRVRREGYDAASTQDIADAVGILNGSRLLLREVQGRVLFEVIRKAQLVIPILEDVRQSDVDTQASSAS